VPDAHPPSAGHVIAVVGAGEQVVQPAEQRALQPVHLRLAAREDAMGSGMACNLGIEVLDQGGEMRLEQRAEAADARGILVGPGDVGLQVQVAIIDLFRVRHR
jgi:hypothetical protein